MPPMPHLQPYFNAFNRRIQLSKSRLQLLNDKRQMFEKEMAAWFKGKWGMTPLFLVQGSMAIGTGVEPLGDDDFDIDIALLLDQLDTRLYDPVAIKKEVETAAQRYQRTVHLKELCVTVEYLENGQSQYHVDLAVYGKNHQTGDRELARGKTHSGDRHRRWEPAAPQHLAEVLTSAFSDPLAQAQFIRLIRYLKRWKDVHFTKVGNSTPPGIALTAMAYRWCQPYVRDVHGDAQIDDLRALMHLVKEIRRNFYGLNITLTVPPGNCILQKLGNSRRHRETYYKQLDQLHDHLIESQTAIKTTNKAAAIHALQQVFGTSFY